jgi:hypothetical protein
MPKKMNDVKIPSIIDENVEDDKKKYEKDNEVEEIGNDVINSLGNVELPRDSIIDESEKNGFNVDDSIPDESEKSYNHMISLMREFLSSYGIRQKSVLNQHQILGMNEIDITNKHKKHMYKYYNRVDKIYCLTVNERMISKDGLGAERLIRLLSNSQGIYETTNDNRQIRIVPNAITKQ